MQRNPALVLLLLLPLALYAPLGQQAYLQANWMMLGLAGAAFLLLGALAFRPPSAGAWRDARFLNMLLLVAYLVHQFEEHGIDATGAHYSFMGSFNEQMGRLAGCAPDASPCPLNPENIFYVNTIEVWLFLLGVMIVDSRRHVFASLCGAALLLVNALAHLQATLVNGAYSPGVATAIALFLPLSLYRYRVLLAEGAGAAWLAASLLWAVLAHAILLALAMATYVKPLLPLPAYPLGLALWVLVPFLVVRRAR